MKKKYTVNDFIPFIQADYILKGSKNRSVDNIKTLTEATEDSLIFISGSNKSTEKNIYETNAGIIICDKKISLLEKKLQDKCVIQVGNPKLIFARIGKKFFDRYKVTPEIHKTALIHKNAKIGKNVYIGPYTYIGNCTIGDNSVIQAHCYVYDYVSIGKNVIILNDCVIGLEGVGYVQNEKGEYESFPEVGSVIIEDDVHIGANTMVDRGSLGNTVLKKGAKIGNGVQIGHNVTIGKNTIVTAHSVIAGSMTVGDNAFIAPNTSTNGHLQIGDRTFIGTGSVVTQNIPDGERWFGSPARPIQEFNIIEKKLKNLTQKK